uniref:Unannotated protein n=1 Tax=freshwater metagenome TaxID=449393 RepID=A0A6J6A0G5_9ZZZZ
MMTVIEKRPRTMMRMIPPMLGIHLPRLSAAIATPIENQMKISLKT